MHRTIAAITRTPWHREVNANFAVQFTDERWQLSKHAPTMIGAERWRATAPRTADGSYQVTSVREAAADEWVTITPQGRRTESRGLAAGNVVFYADAVGQGDASQDVAVALLPNKLEEFVVAHELPPVGTVELRYVVTHGQGIQGATVRPGTQGTVDFVDRLGRGFARLPAAWAVDGTGVRRALELKVFDSAESGRPSGEGGGKEAGHLEVVLTLETTGLVPPVVIDPAWTFGPGFPQETITAFTSFDCEECSDVFGDVAVVGGSGSATVGTLDASNIWGDLSAASINVGANGWLRADAYASPGGYNLTPGALVNQPYTTWFPLPHSVPTVPSFAAGDEDAEPGLLGPGSYGDVVVYGDNEYFLDGVYNLRSLELAEEATLNCDGYCEVRVEESVLIREGATISGSFVVYVAGADEGSQLAFESLAGGRVVGGLVAAPNGTIKLGAEQEHGGRFVADVVVVGSDAVVNGVASAVDYDCASFCALQDAESCDAWSGYAACVSACSSAMVEPDCVSFKRGLVDCWNRSVGAAFCDKSGHPAKVYCEDEQDNYDTCVSVCAQKDDENDCTQDVCTCLPGDCTVGNSILNSALADGAGCGWGAEAGNPCGGIFACLEGHCEVVVPPVNPDDSNPCTMDSCDDGVAVHVAAALGASCETDDDVCNGIDRCDGSGACVPASGPLTGEELDDGNPCTADSCSATTGQVEHTAVADGIACGDGDACNGAETCQSGVCSAGAPVVLEDGDPLTVDVCHDVGGVATIIHATPPTTEELRDTIAPGATMHALARYIVDEGLQVPVGETKAALLARLDAERHRVAIITGRVVDATGAPAANVSVHAKTYEDAAREYGVTRTQASGRFELVVLGQEKPMLIEMSKPGHLQVHRKVLALPDATAALDNDVVLTEKGALMTRPAELPPLEPSLPYVVLGPQSPLQVLEGELEDDVVGSAPPGATRARRPILIFKPGTQAEVVTYPSGGSPEQRVATTTLKLRQREFTTGSDGPLAMPAPLPPTSAYTYALEFTADEVEAAGADTVEFTNQPVIMYVDDFWGFDAGSIVPLGYYNRHLGRWEAEGDGVSLLLLSETGGLARLSHDGSAEMEPAEYASLGIDEEERTLLGTLYQPGKVVWRIPVNHFTPLDPNGFPDRGNDQCVPDDGDCSLPDPVADNGEDDPNCTAGSVIECQNRTLRQTVGVVGTPYTLNYRSDRTPAFKRPYRIKAYLSGNNPPTAIAMRAQLFVAGAMLDEHVVPCASGNCPANETYTFEWDGKTEVGATVGAPVRATVKVSYRYAPPAPILPGVIVAGGSVGGGTGSGAGGGAVGSSFASWPVRDDVEISYVDLDQGATEPPREFWVSRSYRLTIGTLDARVGGLGGWSLSPHHSYIPGARALYRGDGSLRFADTAEPVSEVFAPDDALSFDPQGLALSRDGRWLYIADRKHCVRRMSTVDQSFEVVAGTCGSAGYGGDGQSALLATLQSPWGIAIGPDDDVFFSDAGNHCIRRIDANTGVIETVAGVPTQPGGGDHVALASSMQLSTPRGIAIGDDGTLYIADHGNNRVVAVLSSGLATTVAGDVFGGPAQLPTPSQAADALNLVLHNVYDVDISSTGDLFVVDGGASQSNSSSWVLRVDLAAATAHRYLGSGSSSLTASNFGYGGPGGNAIVVEPHSVTADVRGNVYVVAVDVQQGTPQNPGVWAYGDGVARVVVGGDGTRNPSFRTGVGAVAQELGLYRARELAVASDGTMYIADEDYGGVIVRLDAIFPSTPVGDYHIPSEDGSMVYHFDAAGRHLDTVDAVNNRVLFQFGYDPSHPSRLTSITDVEGRMTTISHSLGEAQITSPFLHTTKVKMVGTSWATEIEDPLQRKTLLDYTMGPSLGKTGLLSSFTTPGQTLAKTYAYDTDGLLEDAGTPGGLTSKNFATTENGTVETVTMTTATGLQTAYSIDQTQAELQTWTMTRPDGTNVVSTRNEDGTRTMVRNDTSSVSVSTEPATAGRLKMATPKRTVVYKSKQTGGKTLTVISDEEAVEATDDGNPLTFDALTTTAKTWVGETTSGTPDRQSTTVFDLDGSICGLTERCLQTTTPEGRVLRRTVDAAGRVLRELAPAGAISLADVEYTYYDTGLLTGYLKEIIAAPGTPDERKYLFEYDTSGRLQKVTDPLGRITQYAYDAADQLLTSTLPSTEVIGFGYTDDGQLNLVDPPGSGTSNQHTMGYDRFMLMDAYTTPAVGTLPRDSVYTFDDDRRLDDKTMPSGDTIDWKYNALGQLYEVDVPASSPSDALGDDLGLAYFTAGDQQGKLQHITAGGTTVAYGYDGSLMTSTTLSLASPALSQTVAWTHDDFLRIASEQVGTGPQIDFTYDDDDLLTGAHITGQPADGVLMTRDPSTGLLTEVRSGSGTTELVTTYAYNAFGEVTSMRTERSTTPAPSLIYEVVYDRDLLGRVAYKTETTSGGIESWGYSYDLEGRLIEVAHGTGQSCKDATPACSPIEAYGYDANGNRTHKGTSLATLALIGTYDHRDRIVTYDGESYVYDDNGMLKQKGSGPNATHYDYDLFGNLRKVSLPSGATITYTIDGLGRRVGRTYDDGINPPDTRYWVYRDQLNPVAELDAAGNVTTQFIYAMGAHVPSYMLKGGSTYRLLTDQLGSVRMVVDMSTGSVVQEIAYDARGVPTSLAGTWDVQPFGFAGGLYDPDAGLYRFGARDYDPEIGRWTAKDPILFGGGQVNLYEYVGGDPVNFVDPAGLLWQYVAGAGLGAVGGMLGYVAGSLFSGNSITGRGLAASAAGGAISGLGIATGNPVIGVATGALGSVASDYLAGRDISVTGALIGAAMGGVTTPSLEALKGAAGANALSPAVSLFSKRLAQTEAQVVERLMFDELLKEGWKKAAARSGGMGCGQAYGAAVVEQ